MKKFLVCFGLVFVALAIVLFFLNPLGPVFLLLSLVIQAPLVLGIARRNFNTSYVERSETRRAEYEENKDGEVWLAGEEAEARSVGFKYWSKAGRSLNALNRAAALCALGRVAESRKALEEAEYIRLEMPDRKRYDALEEKLKGEGEKDQELPLQA